LEGIEGIEKIKKIMEKIRNNPPKIVAGKKVLAIRDYLSSVRTDINNGETEKILLPKSNVIYLELEDKNNFIIRPSGTEPKIKLYCMFCGKSQKELDRLSSLVEEDIKKIIE